jgi:hypothetical protein
MLSSLSQSLAQQNQLLSPEASVDHKGAEEKSEIGRLVLETDRKFPPKPKARGDLGRIISLKTNHYQIRMKKPITVYQYDLDIKRFVSRDVDDMDKMIKIARFMRWGY